MTDGPARVKLILIGNSGVGKSSLTTRYVNHNYSTSHRATIGIDFVTKEVELDGQAVILEIWDTAGTERFKSLGTPMYRWSHCCLLVFDVTSSASFSAMEEWRKEFLTQGDPPDPSNFPFIVVGNKTDMVNREVTREEASQWCEQIGAQYHEGSAKEDVHVTKAFLEAARAGLRQYKKHTLENTGHFQLACKQPRETRARCQC
ncbi:ras-related protein rab7 [Gadus macrocephalus]|uniref:ras-related protein rab7 n=1 Tax=Gadus macrocephalus TaxID=80720 RepID=UPI0028CB1542|nr:ras-related protein rab7 [Gadus macrocephalus]